MPTERIPTVLPTSNRPANLNFALNDDTSRLEAVAKVTGAARYSKDTYLPNSLFVGFIRCPMGAAQLVSMRRDEALALPGVVEVERFGEEGKYQGQPVGYVAAESPAALRRALRALAPQWRPRRFATSIEDEVHDAPPPADDVAQTIERSPHSLSAVYSTQVQTHSSAESHGSVVDHRGDAVTLYASTQGTFAALDGFDEETFGVPLSQVEVNCEHVGGGFGSKLRGSRETLYAAQIAAKHKRPAYLFLDRDEEHLDTGHRPSSRTHVDIGFTNAGNITAGRIQTYGGVGVAGNGNVSFPSGRYNLGEIDKTHESVRFNSCAERPFRAPGGPQGAFAEELMLDEIAAAIDADPLELRTRLVAHEDLVEMLRAAADRIGWKRRIANGAQRSTIRTGYGLGTTSWGRFPANAEAEVVIRADGSVEARTGTQDIGTGQRTAMGVCVADRLGIPLHLVNVRIGRSSLPIGPASGGSMTVHNTAPAMFMAAEEAKKQLLAHVERRLETDGNDLSIHQGQVLNHSEPVMSWQEACRNLAGPITGRGDRSEGVRRYDRDGHSFGAQAVRLSVDVETGQIRVDHVVAVQACGKVVCRKTAENQIIGGVIQGVSYALFEDRILDRATGAMVNPNLEMYKWAGARDVPHIEPIFFTDEQTSPRSLGEPPTIPTAGAIACALFNALGTPVRALPLTPDKVLAALDGARKGAER